MMLHRLTQPQPCAIEFLVAGNLIPCGKPAYWSVNDTPVCMDDIKTMAAMNNDNETFFAPAMNDTATNLAGFLEDVCQYVEQFWTPIFVEHDGERIGWQIDESIPPGWGVECRRRDQFYAYCVNDEIGLDFLTDSQGEDAVYSSYEAALDAIKAAA